MLKYTICFLQRGDDVLMLNRLKTPEMGVWNGVGGKLEPGESPKTCALREIYEETGIKLYDIQEKGTVTWNGKGGMYVFVATLPKDFDYKTPKVTTEGLLDWKPLHWLTDENNQGVAEHIHRSLFRILNDPEHYEHRCLFNEEGHLEEFQVIPLKMYQP
ncbi:8-oxo-dGTP diphosphatase [Pullulanibacillus pueri]|uniref:7,8-dihydro-8-oxoguanine triphosphatase n=1 Tax=Pullulanibacillus pueri TaxID=1437324 RepID=A0A8J2ZTX0_9BACL|nr:8-oxo-dGTP diphosphatase [Pullulanibacillus pueri]MBM7681111.1 8-oxo-dGTP diphosphatase [Pullulanibacillus pueri]GGH77089.1 7,8-dihydro-8-oxoguanine triphosphatase [Pullulanibacillus pueri]